MGGWVGVGVFVCVLCVFIHTYIYINIAAQVAEAKRLRNVQRRVLARLTRRATLGQKF
jgi:hypothetical protein